MNNRVLIRVEKLRAYNIGYNKKKHDYWMVRVKDRSVTCILRFFSYNVMNWRNPGLRLLTHMRYKE